ncbi:amidophosphoribosyltransferase [Alphaproteobacteria bacterium]|jgi:amidophosphoribosyltransferase|nr:amidophosphoribosyltransferase [Alphaproteobacteria bacterium]MDB9872300.1 amidophosphoribosyltransferase [Alphaproteobacteria bacterium]|tara:strand:+ start:1152 stop:2573 length:1422 start_codon:yes stop_codon:yes gene_type:complete
MYCKDNDHMKEECGVFGIFGTEEASVLTTLGLHSLQHRGQEGAGIVSFDGNNFHSIRKQGLVGDNFNNTETLSQLPGKNAIGHVRYSTTGNSKPENLQPFFANLALGGFSCAHNGNLTNTHSLRKKLVENGSIFQTTTDTEIILQLVALSKKRNLIEKLIDALHQIQGAYSLVILTNKKLIGVRDPYGIRPLVLGDKDGSPVLASETCALDMIGAKYIRDIENGEIVIITDSGIESIKPFVKLNERPCIFERIYFASPDSIVGGRTVYTYRKALGEQLALENKIDADVVVPIPDSGVSAAIGFSQTSNIPFELGIIRSHYVGRTFIEPSQTIRQFGVKLKHSVNRSCIENKRVILIDDSIVRGTTANKIVKMVYDAGAKEVHLGVSCPPIKHPDFYGIDTPNYNELIASHTNIEEMTKLVGATSLFFLSLEGTYKAMGCEKRNSQQPQFTDHCFTGEYPIDVSEILKVNSKIG